MNMKGRRMYDDGGVVANTILDQLGGAGRLRMMTGAYNFRDLGNGLSFRIKNQRANYIKIVLTPMDLYDVEVGRVRGTTYKVVNSAEGLFFDQLKPFIEKSTGMYLSLFENGGYIKQNKDFGDGEGVVELKYKVDKDEQSIEVDETTKQYLVELGIVRERMMRKLRNSYIFWYDELYPSELEELEEFFEDSFDLKDNDRDFDDQYEMRDDYARGGELTDAAYRKRMKMFGHKPYGKTKGKYKITYNADGELQTEIWDTLEMAKDSAKRYSRMDDFADVKIFDESGKEIEFMEEGGKIYQLGDKWSDDFDYNGMLRMGLEAKSSWGSKKLQKLFDSFEDVNYHKSSENLWRAIQVLKDAESGKFSKRDIKTFGSEKQAKQNNIKMADEYIDAFHDDILEEMSSYRKGGKVKWIQDALAGKKGTLRATAKRKGLIRGDEKLSKTDLKKLEKMGGKTAKRAYLAETLSKFSDGGMTAGRWYRDNTGQEFKYIGKIDEGVDKGKLIFSDGSKRVFKSLDDFGGRPKENKIFGFFADGGTLDYKKISNVEVSDIDRDDYPDFSDAYISYAEYDGEPMTDEQLEEINQDGFFVYEAIMRRYDKGGDIEDYKRWESRYDMLSEQYEDADAEERKKIQKEMDELESKMHKSERGYAKGGKVKKKRVRFVDKVESIADRLEGTKVPKRLKKDYGGRYNREEAEEAGRRIAGAQLRDRMMEDGGTVNVYGRMKSNEYYGMNESEYTRKNTTKWFKLNGRPITQKYLPTFLEWVKSSYNKRLGRPIEIKVGHIEYSQTIDGTRRFTR